MIQFSGSIFVEVNVAYEGSVVKLSRDCAIVPIC